MSTASFEDVTKIANFIRSKVDISPTIGIICGSGLGRLADVVKECKVLAYTEIPDFPVSTVIGHKGNLVFGKVHDKNVVVMQGRFHPYEGYTNAQIAIPIRVFHVLGVKTILISNASGGLNRKLNVGDMLVIRDHISLPALTLQNVLVGPNEDKFGTRFPSLSDAYDAELRNTFLKITQELNVSDLVHQGVYVCCGGPTYETIAEARMLLMFGADVTGMSTVPEVICARHCGMKVFAVSLVTNKVPMDYETKMVSNHDEVLETAGRRAELMQQLFLEMIKRI